MVFYISIALIVIFVLWGAISPRHLAAITSAKLAIMIEKFGCF